MTARRLVIDRHRSPGRVTCANCDRLTPTATRERARGHAKQHGHTVRYVVEDTTTYWPGAGR